MFNFFSRIGRYFMCLKELFAKDVTIQTCNSEAEKFDSKVFSE